MTDFTAADGALDAGAKAVAQSRADLRNELTTLEGRLNEIGSKWQGAGAAAFTKLMVQWRQDATKIVDALNEFEANLTQSQKTYTTGDQAEAAAFTNFNRPL